MQDQSKITWEVTVQEDPITGDLLLPLPEELLSAVGWHEGDELDWQQTTDGNWVLTKIVK